MSIKGRIKLLKGLRVVLIITLIIAWVDTDMSALSNAITLGVVSAFCLCVTTYVTVVIIRLESFDDFIN